MTSLFMGNTPYAAAEQLMMQPPGYVPRGGGMWRAPKLTFTAGDLDCKLCSHWEKRRCTLDRCVCLEERMQAGAVSYDQLLDELIGRCANPGCRRRIRELAEAWDGALFTSQAHRITFSDNKSIYRRKKLTDKELAALFLLTSTPEMRERSWWVRQKSVIDFSDVNLNGISMEGYTLYQAAKTIALGGKWLTYADLGNPFLIDEATFRIIVHALLISLFGTSVTALEEGGYYAH